MRIIRTFVLRLLTDSDDPQALRGAVRAVDSDEEYAFANGPSLLHWLRRRGQVPEPANEEEKKASP